MDNDLVMNNTGYVPMRDSRNRPYTASAVVQAALASNLPRNPFVTPISDLPILMQSKQPSCVAHGFKFAIQWYIWKQTGQWLDLSARFLYALSKLSDGIAGQGTSIINVARLAYHVGICEAKYFPDDVTLPYAEYIDVSKIPAEAFANAATHKVKDYYFLTDLSYKGITDGIFTHNIVIAGMDIGDHWWTSKDGEITWDAEKLLPLVPNVPPTSRHCIDFYAFNDDLDLLALVNSWSKAWAEDGTAFIYKDEIPYIYEALVIEM